jgi:hypothetical protein
MRWTLSIVDLLMNSNTPSTTPLKAEFPFTWFRCNEMRATVIRHGYIAEPTLGTYLFKNPRRSMITTEPKRRSLRPCVSAPVDPTFADVVGETLDRRTEARHTLSLAQALPTKEKSRPRHQWKFVVKATQLA